MDDLNAQPTPAPVEADTPAPAAAATDTPWEPYKAQLRATWGGTDDEFAAAWAEVIPTLDAAYAEGLAEIQAQQNRAQNRAQAAAAPVIAVSIQTPPGLLAAAQAAEARRVEAERKAAWEAEVQRHVPPGFVRWDEAPPPHDPSLNHPESDLTFWRKYYATRYRVNVQQVAGATKTAMEASAQALDRQNRGIKDWTPPSPEQFVSPGSVPWLDANAPRPAESHIPPGSVPWPGDPVPQRRNSKGQWD